RALLPALLALQLRVTWQLLHQGSMNDRLLPAPKMLPGSSFLVVDAELETGNSLCCKSPSLGAVLTGA
ncbi:mCG61619, partial [Mus musculus]